MALSEFVNIPEAATLAGAPIDAFLLRSLRLNDGFAEKRARGLSASMMVPNGFIFPAAPGATGNVVINAVTDLQKTFLYNAKTIELTSSLTTMSQVPLIWFATEEIRIKNDIIATGMGAPVGKKGDFGGAGGGKAGTVGDNCELPISKVTMATGGTGAAGAPGGIGGVLAEGWASRVMMHLAGAIGGGPGAGASGGAGGGIVILCAPKISIDVGKKIIAKGANATAASGGPHGDGGGGGGLVVLIAHEFTNVTAGTSVLVDGGDGFAVGAPNHSGGKGGNGLVLKYQYS